MKDWHLDINAGFCAYADGSGHQVSVSIRKEAPESEALISIESVGGVTIAQWKEVTRGVAKLLNGIPEPA